MIRTAVTGDAEAFFEIKKQLPISRMDGNSAKGGFLLGTDVPTYRFYIENSFCLVAEVDDDVVGFGIIFGDAMLRKSDVWLRRHQAHWIIDLTRFENKRLCYFEQLAFLAGHRKLAVSLGYQLAKMVFDTGVEAMFTTTVNEPVQNLAAIPFIKTVGGTFAGNINEDYSAIGPVKSDIFIIDAQRFYTKTQAHPLFPILSRQNTSFR